MTAFSEKYINDSSFRQEVLESAVIFGKEEPEMFSYRENLEGDVIVDLEDVAEFLYQLDMTQDDINALDYINENLYHKIQATAERSAAEVVEKKRKLEWAREEAYDLQYRSMGED